MLYEVYINLSYVKNLYFIIIIIKIIILRLSLYYMKWSIYDLKL